ALNSNKFSSIPAKTSKLQKHATLFGCRQPDIRPPLPHHKPAAADQNVRGATNVSMGSGHNGVSGDMEKHLNAIMEKQPQNMVSLGKHATLPIAIMRCGLSKLLGREASFNNLMHVRVTSSPDLVSKLINAATDSSQLKRALAQHSQKDCHPFGGCRQLQPLQCSKEQYV
ncbi:unnamed protein product, partial [Closterium sp. NIES-54]